MTLSMFPEYPDDEVHPTRDQIETVPWTREWVLLRAKGRRINDNPVWHRRRYFADVGAVMAVCGYYGSLVVNEVSDGAQIVPCGECLRGTNY